MNNKQTPKRFIDLAEHGGCSKKLAGHELEDLLGEAYQQSALSQWGDAGKIEADGRSFYSTVDIVLPMINDPIAFGEIAVLHAFSDLYAVGATPLMALNIISTSPYIRTHKENIIAFMKSGKETIQREGAILVGGHSMELDDCFYGIAAFGEATRPNPSTSPQQGDVLILTKPLGTSIATKMWHDNLASANQFPDVIEGMRSSNKMASILATTHRVVGCTDVSGFGLINHLAELLGQTNSKATLDIESIPYYDSLNNHTNSSIFTRMFTTNHYSATRHLNHFELSTSLQASILFDAQVSGGLLCCFRPQDGENFIDEARNYHIDARLIGHIDSNSKTTISLLGL